MPAKIRVGLVGLSSTNTDPMKPGAWAHSAHLPALLNLPDYELVALSNSSKPAAEKAISILDLPPSTRAYGSVEELAQDPNVDLIVITVNVKDHAALAKPAILAKKDVFVEWPLGANTAEAKELTKLANAHGVRNMVGLQARADPMIAKMKQIIESGRIGEVISSFASAAWSAIPPDVWPARGETFLDINTGSNAYSVFFGHFLDSFTDVVGDFAEVKTTLKNQWKSIKIMDAAGNVVDPAHPKNVPDHIFVTGTLTSGAVASVTFRTVRTAASSRGYHWVISGTEGEIEVDAPEGFWQVWNGHTTLKVKTKDAEEVITFAGDVSEHVEQVPFMGKNTAGLYDAFAQRDGGKIATFESALQTHRLLDRILEAAN